MGERDGRSGYGKTISDVFSVQTVYKIDLP